MVLMASNGCFLIPSHDIVSTVHCYLVIFRVTMQSWIIILQACFEQKIIHFV